MSRHFFFHAVLVGYDYGGCGDKLFGSTFYRKPTSCAHRASLDETIQQRNDVYMLRCYYYENIIKTRRL